ncbi:MAG TPA: hypothetical protein VK922_12625 [Gemmatimonadaceae bacterium]|nr:hypothetical protein [Gemmatimonadaceae bacterium]
MTARERLTRARAALIAAAVASALLWGTGVALAVYASLVGAALAGARWIGGGTAIGIATSAGLAVVAAVAWRRRRVWSASHVALWIEERVPALRYALVSALEEDASRSVVLERHVAGTEWRPALRTAAARAIGVPAIALAIAALIVVTLPAVRRPLAAATRAPAGRLTTDGRPVEEAARLSPLRVRVQPPSYTGLSAAELDDPSGIPALAGSRIVVRGPGQATGLAARLGDTPLTPGADGADWRVSLTMPSRPAALRLSTGEGERLIVLEPRPDSVPRVALLQPVRDTIFRAATGTIRVAAEARDDFGLDALRIEYIVSSGQGESFTFKSGVLGTRAATGRTAEVRARTTLQALELEPGDIVHLRAVASDRNDVSGPGIGYSETRMLRIARPDEYDSLSIEPLPPLPGDTGLLSQRMLIEMAEEVERRRPRLARSAVIEESRRIAMDQARLRRQVGEIIFMRLGGDPSGEHSHEGESPEQHAAHAPPEGRLTPEQLLAAAEAATNRDMSEALDFHGDETPVVAVNRPLLEAYNAMWDAGRELEIGEPDDALPHMRLALEAIQRARTAERIYLRGRAPAVIVDLARVRLAGRRDGVEPAAVRPPVGQRAATVRWTARFDAALDRLAAGDPAGADTLALLRLDALEEAPALATAVGEAIDALRAGRDATDALATARRLLAGDIAIRRTLPRWTGDW